LFKFIHEEGATSGEARVAMFTDTFDETNGVALTLKKQVEIADRHSKKLFILGCNPDAQSTP